MPTRPPRTPDLPVERLDPARRDDHQAALHYVRYDWAAQFVRPAARVLDCSCGLGYGTAILADAGAAEVLGIDIDAAAIATARRRYSRPTIKYRRADAFSLTPDSLGAFDLIVSLETIEHVPRPRDLLAVFASLLNLAGLLALSCPNDRHLGADNPFHLWKADHAQLAAWLRDLFPSVAEFAEVHTLAAGAVPAAALAAPPPPAPMPTRLIGSLPIDLAGGFLFACSRAPIHSLPAAAAHMLAGFDYLRELEAGRRWLEQSWRNWKKTAEDAAARIAKLESAANQPPRTGVPADEARDSRDRAAALAVEVETLAASRANLERLALDLKASSETRALEIDRLTAGKAWLQEQYDNYRAIAQRHAAEIQRLLAADRARDESLQWLESQRRSWEQECARRDADIASLKDTIRALEEGKAWLQQRAAAFESLSAQLQKERDHLAAALQNARQPAPIQTDQPAEPPPPSQPTESPTPNT